MVSPTSRRRAVAHVQQMFHISERRACRVLGQHRSVQQYRPAKGPKQAEDARIAVRLHELAAQHPRYGYRRMWALLRREGFAVNRKRVQRLWHQEGLKVPQHPRQRRAVGHSTASVVNSPPIHKNDVWCWDFSHSTDAFGRPLKWLSLVDEFTREGLAVHVERSITADDALDVLRDVFVVCGVPKRLRSDNGPEFIAHAMQQFLQAAMVGTLYIEPGSPWQNGYAESFNSKLKDELIHTEVIDDLKHAKQLARDWLREYNEFRPHSSLNYLTPAAYAATLEGPPLATLVPAPPTK